MAQDLFEDFSFGHKHYQTIDNVRHLVGLRSTIRLNPGELPHHFEMRMERLENLLRRNPTVINVELAFRFADKVIVECEVIVALKPEPQPILEQPVLVLTIPARRAKARGNRGGGNKG